MATFLFFDGLSNYFTEIVKICFIASTNPVLESIPFMVISLLIACVPRDTVTPLNAFVTHANTLETILFRKIIYDR